MKVFRNILSSVFAFYFLVAGTGFNIINYCCNNTCMDAKADVMAVNSCEKMKTGEKESCTCCGNVGHHTMAQQQQIVCHPKAPENCHEVKRVNVDTPSLENRSHQFDIKWIDCFGLSWMENTLIAANHLMDSNSTVFTDPPPEKILFTGRDILTFHSVLLI